MRDRFLRGVVDCCRCFTGNCSSNYNDYNNNNNNNVDDDGDNQEEKKENKGEFQICLTQEFQRGFGSSSLVRVTWPSIPTERCVLFGLMGPFD